MNRALVLAFVLVLGCGGGRREGEETVPAETDAAISASVVEPTVSTSYRDSISEVFRVRPDSILLLMRPEKDPEDVRIATALLETSSGEAKLRFAHYLVTQGERSVSSIVSLVRRSDDGPTLVAAIQTLGKLKASVASETVAAHLKTPDSWVRIAAAHALGDIGGTAVIDPLVIALRDTTDTVISAALIALGKTGNPAVLSACADQLRHANPRVRAAAVSAITRLGHAQDTRLLRPLLNDTDSGVRFKAQQGIDRLRASKVNRG